MSVDPWLRELANVNRERQAEQRSRLDERWDRLSGGDLSPEEEAELRALAETSEEAKEAYEAFRPLGPGFHAGVAKTLRDQGLVPDGRTEEVPKPLPFRRRSAARWAGWGSLAAVAAVLLVMVLRPPAPLPDYSVVDISGGVSSMRGEQPEAKVPAFAPGDRCRIKLRPGTTVPRAKWMEAKFFLSRNANLRHLEAQSTFDPRGSVDIETKIGRDVPPGIWTLWTVVGRQGAIPDQNDLKPLLTKAQVRQRDWVAVPQKVQIQPRDLPP